MAPTPTPENPVFTYGDGWSGRSFYVNGTLVYNNALEEDAKIKAVEYCASLGVKIEIEDIKFTWNGTM